MENVNTDILNHSKIHAVVLKSDFFLLFCNCNICPRFWWNSERSTYVLKETFCVCISTVPLTINTQTIRTDNMIRSPLLPVYSRGVVYHVSSYCFNFPKRGRKRSERRAFRDDYIMLRSLRNKSSLWRFASGDAALYYFLYREKGSTNKNCRTL